MKSALSKRTKQERRKAYLAADERDPVALLVAVAEAENAEVDEEKKEEIKELRLFIHANQRAFSDYRTILQEKGIDVSNMRTMGAAERSEEHTSELQSRGHLVCRLLLEKRKNTRMFK